MTRTMKIHSDITSEEQQLFSHMCSNIWGLQPVNLDSGVQFLKHFPPKYENLYESIWIWWGGGGGGGFAFVNA